MSIHDIAEKEEAEMSKEEYADYVQSVPSSSGKIDFFFTK
jgi:hypothetical protein